LGEETQVKVDGVYISTNSLAYIQLMEKLGRDEYLAYLDSPTAPEAVQEITAVAREPFTPLDSYRIETTGPLSAFDKAPVLMKRQAPFYTEENK
jgi:hypothetical protein